MYSAASARFARVAAPCAAPSGYTRCSVAMLFDRDLLFDMGFCVTVLLSGFPCPQCAIRFLLTDAPAIALLAAQCGRSDERPCSGQSLLCRVCVFTPASPAALAVLCIVWLCFAAFGFAMSRYEHFVQILIMFMSLAFTAHRPISSRRLDRVERLSMLRSFLTVPFQTPALQCLSHHQRHMSFGRLERKISSVRGGG